MFCRAKKGEKMANRVSSHSILTIRLSEKKKTKLYKKRERIPARRMRRKTILMMEQVDEDEARNT